jgi:hypothetical protein
MVTNMRAMVSLVLLASLVAGCGAADVGDEGADGALEDLGELSQALGFWGVSFQQGQPAQLCGPASNDPCTLFAAKYNKTEDTTVRAVNPSTNYGSESTLKVSTISAANADVALVKWDLRQLAAALPSTAKLTAAKLTVHVTTISPVDKYKVAKNVVPWSESTATWNSWRWHKHSPLAPLGWLEPSALGKVEIELDIDDFGPLLKTWLADHATNHGLWIGHPGATAPVIAFGSSETTLAAAAPKLQLWFRTP